MHHDWPGWRDGGRTQKEMIVTFRDECRRGCSAGGEGLTLRLEHGEQLSYPKSHEQEELPRFDSFSHTQAS